MNKNKTQKYPLRYLPKKLSRRDRTRQKRELLKSRKSYQKGIYYTRRKLPSFQSKKSPHIQNAQDLYNVSVIDATDELAKASGCSKASLAKVISKGEGAYFSSGSRPNQTAQSWGKARLASTLTAGKAAVVDYSILKSGCKPGSLGLKMANKAIRIYGKTLRRAPKVN